MFRSVIAASVLALAFNVNAQQAAGQVVSSDCQPVAKSTSAAGAIGGSAVGGVVGGWVGEALFGRAGRSIGAGLGGIGGAFAGEGLATTTTYECLLAVDTADGKVWAKSVGRLYNPGQAVIIVKLSDGSYAVR